MARARWISFSLSMAAWRDVFLADELRIGGGDMHREVAHELLKIVRASHEIGLAVDFHQHAQLRAGVDVGTHHALLGGAGGFLAG